jgi:hypothetical protein
MLSTQSEVRGQNWGAIDDETMVVAFHLQSPNGNSVKGTSRVIFSKHFAVSALVDSEDRYGRIWMSVVVFDLQQMAWYDPKTREWIDLRRCQEWERESIARTTASLSKSNDTAARGFIEAAINPQLQRREQGNGILVLFNDYVSYEVTPEVKAGPHQLQRFVAYDRLNAYHKAMNDRQLPPTTQVEVDNMLAEAKVLPKRLVVTIKTAHGQVIATTDTKFDKLDKSDRELLQQELAKLPR